MPKPVRPSYFQSVSRSALTQSLKKVTTVAALCVAASSVIAAPATAQNKLNSVEVLVNDEPISSFDIYQRLRLVIAISGGVNSEQEFNRIREQVIQAMVDEKLQLQEARQFELVVPDEQLESFFARRAQGVGQSPEQFEEALRSIGSSKTTMKQQINAEYAWSELVNGRLGQFVDVTNDEVEAYINRIKSNRGKTEYRLSEIVLLVNSPEQEEGIKANAQQIVERLRDGATFADLARQLSASPTAVNGGDLGWITTEDLNDFQRQALENTEIGAISDPIRTAGGYLILNHIDDRRILTADPLDDQVHLKQFFLRNSKVADPELRAKYEATVAEMRENGVTCANVEDYVAKGGAEETVDIGALVIRAMSLEVRKDIVGLEVGDISPTLEMDDGLRTLVVCGRDKSEVQEPVFENVQNQLEQQRLALMARRYLRDLRRKAIIDYR